VSRYSYSKTVLNLSAPADYRTTVRFRWLDAGGAAIKRERVTSRVCRQPDMHPDLTATRIDAVQGGYAVVVANDGRTESGQREAGQEPGEQPEERRLRHGKPKRPSQEATHSQPSLRRRVDAVMLTWPV